MHCEAENHFTRICCTDMSADIVLLSCCGLPVVSTNVSTGFVTESGQACKAEGSFAKSSRQENMACTGVQLLHAISVSAEACMAKPIVELVTYNLNKPLGPW